MGSIIAFCDMNYLKWERNFGNIGKSEDNYGNRGSGIWGISEETALETFIDNLLIFRREESVAGYTAGRW